MCQMRGLTDVPNERAHRCAKWEGSQMCQMRGLTDVPNERAHRCAK